MWQKPKSTFGIHTKVIHWMDLLPAHFTQARDAIILFKLKPRNMNLDPSRNMNLDPSFSRSAAENACINIRKLTMIVSKT